MSIPGSISISEPILIPEPIPEPTSEAIQEPIPQLIPKLLPIPEPIPILETYSESASDSGANSYSGPTIWNRFQKTLKLAGIDSNENLIFPITSANHLPKHTVHISIPPPRADPNGVKHNVREKNKKKKR